MATEYTWSVLLLKTLRVRVKDRHTPVLRRMAAEVNAVWNACNAHQIEVFRREGRFLSGFDFAPFVVGASSEFELIGSTTIDEIRDQYAVKRRAAKRVRLRWRRTHGRRRSLGWVPFKSRGARWRDAAVRFAGRRFGVWDSYGLGDYAFRAGSFVEDARGRWYCCVQVAVEACWWSPRSCGWRRPWPEGRCGHVRRRSPRARPLVPGDSGGGRSRPASPSAAACRGAPREGA